MTLLAGLVLAVVATNSWAGVHSQKTNEAAVTENIAAPFLESHGSTKVRVHLPSGYDASRPETYPIVFFLHGWGENEGAFDELGGPTHLANLPNSLQPIIVAVDGATSGYMDWADEKHRWESHLLKSIIPTIVRKYRGDVSRIALYGVSMGGEAALRLAMSHPSQFSCVAAHYAALSNPEFDTLPEWQRNGYLQMADFAARFGQPFNSVHWKKNNALHLAQTVNAEDLRTISFFFDVGRDDRLGFDEGAASLSATFSRRDIPHTFALRNGDHAGDFMARYGGEAVRFLASCLAAPTEKGLRSSG